MSRENNPFQRISDQLRTFEEQLRVQDILKAAATKLRQLNTRLRVPYWDEAPISNIQIIQHIQEIIDLLTDESSPYTQEIRVQQRTIDLLERMANLAESMGVSRNPYVAETRNVVETWRAGPFTDFKGEDGCHES